MPQEASVHGVPLFLILLSVSTVAVTYVWSVGNGHVSPFFPYISDTGAFPPESCLFTEMTSISAVLMFLTMYFRYLMLRDFANVDNLSSFNTLILTNLILGTLVALGVSLVGSYQSINMPSLHLLGAFIVFGLGATYTIIDTVISYHTAIFPNQGRQMCHLRAAIAGTATFCVLLTVGFGFVAQWQRTDMILHPNFRLVWRPQDGGYTAHLVSTTAEWVVGLAELLYFVTFVPELSNFRIPFPKLHPVDPKSTLRQGGSSSSRSSRGDMRETEPLLQSKSKQFLYIGSGVK